MIAKPPKNRNTITWHVFEQKSPDEWVLRLPSYYDALFCEQEPDLMNKSNTGWGDSSTGKTKFAFFIDLIPEEIERIKRFINDYSQFVIVGPNETIREHFSDELDFCMALDRHFASEGKRTTIGELIYQAKYVGGIIAARRAIKKIVEHLEYAFKRMPKQEPLSGTCLSYIPHGPNKSHDLPEKLAKALSKKLRKSSVLRKEHPLIHPTLTIDKPSSKGLRLDKKVIAWQKIISSGRIELSDSVNGNAVYVIDDLYQSGVTMWSYAKYLKSAGATTVLGLVCTKTGRDTDNI